MIPGMTGFELSRRIREGGSAMPIILLTARDAIDDRVRGLDSGADDYLIKPFDFAELGARLRALLRREAGQRTTVTVGQLELDSMSMQATLGGERVTLSVKEFIILRLLAASAGSLVLGPPFLRRCGVPSISSRRTSWTNTSASCAGRLSPSEGMCASPPCGAKALFST